MSSTYKCHGNKTIGLSMLAVCGLLTVSLCAHASARMASIGELPLSFEQNLGQTDAAARYLARGPGYAMFFTPDQTVLTLSRSATEDCATRCDSAAPDRTAVIGMQFVGAQAQTRVIGEQRSSAQSHYLVGDDQSRWQKHVPHFAQIRYQGLYPGVDAVFYGSDQRQLEYDFIVAPGASYQQISLQFNGAESVSVDNKGQLVIHTALGDIVQMAPVIYQLHDGRKQLVKGSYRLEDKQRVGFTVAEYDRDLPLVIDPVMLFSSYLGGVADISQGVTLDGSGNIYVAGFTKSTSYPVVGGVQSALNGPQDAFVTKLSPDGSSIIYSTYLGGSATEIDGGTIGSVVAVDAVGNVTLTGRTDSTDFPTTAGAHKKQLGGTNDFYVTKLNRAGDAILYSTYLGGDGVGSTTGTTEAGPTVALDASGNVYILGFSSGADWPLINPVQGYTGGLDAVVAKLDPSLSMLIYSTYIGGTGDDKARAIAVDRNGNAYLTGRTDSRDFPVLNPYQATARGRGDVFVTKLDPAGFMQYSTYVGGGDTDKGRGIAVDTAGNVFVTGNTQSTNFPVVTPAQGTSMGGGEGFLFKLDPSGTALLFSSYFGGSGDDLGSVLALDRRGNIYIGGYSYSDDYPVYRATQTLLGGGQDATVTVFNAKGNRITFASYLGGTGDDYATGIGVDRSGNVVLVGNTNSTDLPLLNAFQNDAGGAFITRIMTGR